MLKIKDDNQQQWIVYNDNNTIVTVSAYKDPKYNEYDYSFVVEILDNPESVTNEVIAKDLNKKLGVKDFFSQLYKKSIFNRQTDSTRIIAGRVFNNAWTDNTKKFSVPVYEAVEDVLKTGKFAPAPLRCNGDIHLRGYCSEKELENMKTALSSLSPDPHMENKCFIHTLSNDDIRNYVDKINKECDDLYLLTPVIKRTNSSIKVRLQNYYEYSGDIMETFNMQLRNFCIDAGENMKPEFKEKFERIWREHLTEIKGPKYQLGLDQYKQQHPEEFPDASASSKAVKDFREYHSKFKPTSQGVKSRKPINDDIMM